MPTARMGLGAIIVNDSKSNNLLATLRTSMTPTQMALTMDRKYLLVGHEDSQYAYVYDLNTMLPMMAQGVKGRGK